MAKAVQEDRHLALASFQTVHQDLQLGALPPVSHENTITDKWILISANANKTKGIRNTNKGALTKMMLLPKLIC